ncbi:MAG: hypothetical protein EOP06_09785 [Proteobacteria bacterium]|nr:MAG: hypothetical protein EOP06_09785 [Pseudomonadota bacterium]
MTKSEAAFLLSCDRLAKQGRLYFWTFTFSEVLDLVDTRKKWNHLLTLIRRRWPDACGLRVFEMHKEHGLHVHLLTNKRIDVNQCRQLSKRSGWGRIHVMRIPKEQTPYLAKYLSKDRPKAFKRWRLWAGFGKCWDWTKVAQIQVESLHATVARGLRDAYGWKGNRDFRARRKLLNEVVAATVLNNWEPGLGPAGRPYNECSAAELIGAARK